MSNYYTDNAKDGGSICGNCTYCKYAVRSKVYSYAKRFGVELVNCKIYEKTDKNEYSDTEKAIVQIGRCESCKEYYESILKLREFAKSIPDCFLSMNEASCGHISKISYEVDEILDYSKYCKCKEKIVLYRIIKEYLSINPSKPIDCDKLCKYLKEKEMNSQFYIHPITVKYLVDNM